MIKRVLLVADVGEKSEGYYHIGDEAMLYQNYRLYRDAGDFEITVQGWSATLNALEAASHPVWEIPSGKPGAREIASLVRRVRWHRHLPRVPIPARLAEFMNLFRAHDLVHISGGGNLNSLYPRELYARAWIVCLARLVDVPVLASSQTLGPFTDPTDEKIFARAFDQLDALTLRDERESAALARKYLPHPRTSVTFDDAYLLEPTSRDALEPFWLTRDESALRVGVSLHGDDDALAESVACALNQLLQVQPLQIYFIPHVAVANDATLDVPYHRTIAARLDPRIASRVLTHRDLFTQPEPRKERLVKGLTAAMDIVIATRYHALVFALSSAVPTLALNLDAYYTTKNLGLLEMLFGAAAQNFALNLADASAERVAKNLRGLLTERETIQARLRNQRAQFARARDQNLRLANDLIREHRERNSHQHHA